MTLFIQVSGHSLSEVLYGGNWVDRIGEYGFDSFLISLPWCTRNPLKAPTFQYLIHFPSVKPLLFKQGIDIK